jgi:hypothetical protein
LYLIHHGEDNDIADVPEQLGLQLVDPLCTLRPEPVQLVPIGLGGPGVLAQLQVLRLQPREDGGLYLKDDGG